MINSKKLICAWLFFSIIAFLGCKKDEEDPNENELITTVRLKFTEGGVTSAFEFKDPDGDGGNAPIKFEKISLKPNKTYQFEIQLLNESISPAEDITKEVEAKKDEHLFVYTPTPVSLLAFSITDKDTKNYPVGIQADVKTTATGTGKLKVQLRHQPGTKNGTATPGSDDVNLDFDVDVK